MTNGGNTLQLNNLGYEDMAGTYKCTVTGVGGPSSGNSTLEVYCKYLNESYSLQLSVILSNRQTYQIIVNYKQSRKINLEEILTEICRGKMVCLNLCSTMFIKVLDTYQLTVGSIYIYFF